jgi:predicted dehydrogenase
MQGDIMSETMRDPLTEAISRREFVQTAAAVGAGAGLLGAWPALGGPLDSAGAVLPVPAGIQPPAKADEVRVAIVGAGSQGRNLINNCLKIAGVRFVAVCDIWPYSQSYAAKLLKKYDQEVRVYAACDEMLAQEKSLDAVIVATPDWLHAEQTVACLKAGMHVYCEKEMSSTLEGAAAMVRAARETGKLLQIGHQRRSNPRYAHALRLLTKDKVCGRITHVNGQWNRARALEVGWPKGKELDEDTLRRAGYDTMERFCNWRWYKKYSGGPMADLGSHQIDVYNWFLAARPTAVIASGGRDYYQEREWYDNVMTIYEYETGPLWTAKGDEVDTKTVRAFYQVLNTTSHGGFFECFMGDEGSLIISEDPRKGLMFREPEAKRREWEDLSEKVESMDRDAITLKIGETLAPDGTKDPEGQRLLEESRKPEHQLHLENFFSAIRTGSPLSCPPDVGYETCVSVLKANEAVAAARRLAFQPGEFAV